MRPGGLMATGVAEGSMVSLSTNNSKRSSGLSHVVFAKAMPGLAASNL